jgi:hypothetical protein
MLEDSPADLVALCLHPKHQAHIKAQHNGLPSACMLALPLLLIPPGTHQQTPRAPWLHACTQCLATMQHLTSCMAPQTCQATHCPHRPLTCCQPPGAPHITPPA